MHNPSKIVLDNLHQFSYIFGTLLQDIELKGDSL